jgi:hypothetical protein
MNTFLKYCLLFISFIFIASCEKEKTEYHQTYNHDIFKGFSADRNYFILHDNSITYYNPDSNKVFHNLFEHQNGKKLGNSIHSFHPFFYNYVEYKNSGVFSLEDENKLVYIDLNNFVYDFEVEIESPRNIELVTGESYVMRRENVLSFHPHLHGSSDHQSILVSAGSGRNGKLVVIIPYSNIINSEINTGNDPGKIYVHDYDYVYVFCNEKSNQRDSTIAKIHFDNYDASDFQKVEDIYIGINPVDFVEFAEYETGFYNPNLAILCKGDENTPASIVLFDLLLNKITDTYSFGDSDLKPERIINFRNYSYSDQYNPEVWFYANKKIYSANLSNLKQAEVLIDKDITELHHCFSNVEIWESFLGVSNNSESANSYLYRFKHFYPYEVIDSIKIGEHAHKIVSSSNY